MSINYSFQYEIVVETLTGEKKTVSGRQFLGDARNQVIVDLPEGRLVSVSGHLPIVIASTTRIFVNGFQTWTLSEELTPNDRLLPRAHFPRFLVDHFGLDRYGDNYFVPYTRLPGEVHGENYGYLRDNKAFRFFASCDETNGYTIFTVDSNEQQLIIERDAAGLMVGGRFVAFDLYFAQGSETKVFDGWFKELNVQPITDEKLAGYTSWYNRYQNISEATMLQDLEGGYENGLRPGDTFQIDDGWETYVGDWIGTDPTKFPSGLKPLVDEIHDRGYKAGLWLAPFVAEKKSKLLKEHPDWAFIHKGKPWRCGSNWSGFYALDIDNPEVVDYLRKTFDQVFNEWHFDLVKLDFLYAAAPFGTDHETRGARMNRAVRLLRELCGDKLILGCGVPVMSAFGQFEYCRISCDVGFDWNNTPIMRVVNRESVSTYKAITNTVYRRQLNGRAYLSDPDVFILRDKNCKMNDKQKKLLAKVNCLLGGVYFHSDDMGSYNEKTKAFYQELRDLYTATDKAVSVDDERIVISYKLHGEPQELVITRRGLRQGKIR